MSKKNKSTEGSSSSEIGNTGSVLDQKTTENDNSQTMNTENTSALDKANLNIPSDEHLWSLSRNSLGLYSCVYYALDKDRFCIDWKKQLKPEHFTFVSGKKEEILKKYNVKTLSELNPLEVDENYVLLLLSGVKYLARLRGYSNIRHEITHIGNDRVSSICYITWIPNIETQMKPVVSCGVGSADRSSSFSNTSGFGQNYLESIAENRAFVRCVRNFLNINIVGSDEIKQNHVQEPTESFTEHTSFSSSEVLEQKAKSKNVSFAQLIAYAKSNPALFPNGAEWQSFEDIPAKDAFVLLTALNK